MTAPAVEGLLTVPYVSVAEFTVAPTWVDVANLVPTGSAGANQDELNNVLLRASSWADNYVGQRFGAHTVTEQTRTRINRDGTVYLHPSNVPVRSIVGIAYGSDFKNLTALTDLTQTWVEDARGIVVSMIPLRGSWSGSLEFGTVSRSSAIQLYVQYAYVAGYANTTLTVAANSGTSSLTVADPTGFVPPSTSAFSTTFGASTARIWDAGIEEAVTVSPSYVQGANPIVLSASLANTHAIGVQVSELPAEVRQAVICYAVGLLLREDASKEMPWSGSPGPSARRSGSGGKAGGLVDEAERLLERYCRVR